MNAPAVGSAAYEVESDFLQLRDPDGHRHFLRRGWPLPDWVPDDQRTGLVESGAVTRIETI